VRGAGAILWPRPFPERTRVSEQDQSERLAVLAELYGQYLERRERGEALELEAWCAQHPDYAEGLRALHRDWGWWKEVFGALSRPRGEPESRRLADELRERFGDVDPGVSLGGERPQEDSGPSSELLRRLRAHAPKNSRYRLLGEVGRGGMGAVVRVWDEDLRRTLAMKVVLGREDSAGKGPTPPVDSRTLGRFLEEAQVTGQLDHPGIVPVHELGLGSDGQVYFTMRLVRGEDLKAVFGHVESGHEGWNTTRALGVMLKVCEAMAYAHSKGVIHRDLKPANIMAGRFGEVYVMDWGLARVIGRKDLHDVRLQDAPATSQSIRTERREERADTPDSPLVTMDGDVVGTPAYMSPEQAMGKVKELGPQSDVYAVGAMLYHLLAVSELEMPYVPKGARMSARSVHLAVVQGPPKPLFELAPKAPAELVAIIEKAMSRELSARYPNMDALASDLRAFLEGRVVSAFESGSWAEAKKWVQRNKSLTVAAAAAVIALVGGIAFSWNFALDADAQRATAESERGRTARANTTLNEKVAELRAQAREAKLRGLAQDLARFRAQCRTTEGLERLGKPAWLWWLEQADLLLDGRDEDLAKGIEWSPGRKDVQSKLAELRERALPYSEEDRAKDLASQPAHERILDLEVERDERLSELREGLEAANTRRADIDREIAYFEHRLGSLPWPSEVEVAARNAERLQSTDAAALNSAAWNLVDPDEARSSPEQLILAALLARRGVELAAVADSWAVRDTLAWALVWLGRGEEALAMADSAIARVPGERAAELRSSKERMQAELARWTDETRSAREAELAALRGQLADLPSVEPLEQALATKEASVTADYAARIAAEIEDRDTSPRGTWRFERSEDEWWHAQLAALDSDLVWLEQTRNAAREANCTERAQRLWSEAIEAIARSPKYAGQRWPSGERLTPQVGLLPLGRTRRPAFGSSFTCRRALSLSLAPTVA